MLRGEEQPTTLVTRQHVERTWRGVKRSWFHSYAWPMSEDVWVSWSPDPERWAPTNHSCEPTLWLDGLDAVARRDLQAGEALTMDYGTFCGPGMAPFDCTCGAETCRGHVTAEDLLEGPLAGRYGDRVSAWVKQERQRRARLQREPAPPPASPSAGG